MKFLGIPVLDAKDVEVNSRAWVIALVRPTQTAYTCIIVYLYLPPSLALQGVLPFTLQDLESAVSLMQLDSPFFHFAVSCVPILALIRLSAVLINTTPSYVFESPSQLRADGRKDGVDAGEGHNIKGELWRKVCRTVCSLVLFSVSWLLLLASLQPFYSGLDLSTEKLSLYQNAVPDSYRLLSRYHVTNSYGLFRRMTGVGGRPELIIQGSSDGKTWQDYELPYKPQKADQRALFNVPHQPRLDWQMWFAALGSLNENVWVVNLINRLFSNSPSVMTLFKTNPFEEEPPEHIRIQYYLLNFTTIDSHPWAEEQLPFLEAVSKAHEEASPYYWTGKYVVDWLPRLTQSGHKLDKLWTKWRLPNPDVMKTAPHPVHPLHYWPLVDCCLGLLVLWAVQRTYRVLIRKPL